MILPEGIPISAVKINNKYNNNNKDKRQKLLDISSLSDRNKFRSALGLYWFHKSG
jgi:hypothetical protein